jgi:hypothetical protein
MACPRPTRFERKEIELLSSIAVCRTYNNAHAMQWFMIKNTMLRLSSCAAISIILVRIAFGVYITAKIDRGATARARKSKQEI